ncbi:MAG: prepilin-type N-terminal cleavage/methylation domain-containing protein [Planctomycetota bacterium]
MNRRCRGFSLIEFLVAISILAVVMSIFGRVMINSVTVQGDVHDAAWSNDRLSEVLSQVRADVWSARSLSIDGTGALIVAGADDVRFRWTVDSVDVGDDDGETEWLFKRITPDGEHRAFQLPELRVAPSWTTRGNGRVTIRLDEAEWGFASEFLRLSSKERP